MLHAVYIDRRTLWDSRTAACLLLEQITEAELRWHPATAADQGIGYSREQRTNVRSSKH